MKYSCKNNIKDNYIENLLHQRGIEDCDKYLHPKEDCLCNPYLLDNIKEATTLFLSHIKDSNSDNVIIIDCDQDGYTSAAMIWNYCKQFYSDCNLRYKIHSGKQHGLEDMIEQLEEERPNLVIIPDAGSNDYDYHRRLKEVNCNIIVIDHHEAEKYSEDAIVINNQLSSKYPNKHLSGAGVTYKFLQVLDDFLQIKNANNYLDLAAIGIIGDMMSMNNYENRYIAYCGLKNITNSCIKEIIKKQDFSIKDNNNITPTDVSFYITPLVNALIRVGKESEKEILFQSFINGTNIVPKISRGKIVPDQYESIAEQNARNCVNARSRQNRQLDKAIEGIDIEILKNGLDENKIIVAEIKDDKIDSTLTGLLAMKVVAKYHKPTLLGRFDDFNVLKGSVRGENKSALKDTRQFLLESNYFDFAEGHAQACGFAIPEKNIENFIDYSNKELKDIDFNEGIYEVDFLRKCDDKDLKELIFELGKYPEIWGKDNEEAIIGIDSIKVNKKDINIIGRNSDTIKFEKNGIVYLRFFAKELIDKISNMNEIEFKIVGKANVNEWCGNVTPQIMIEDYEVKDITFDF